MGKLLLGLFFLARVGTGWCEGARTIPVSLCMLDGHPKRYNGKMVQVRGSVVGAEGLYLSSKCGQGQGGMALSIPEENSNPPSPFRLVHDEAFDRFSYLLGHLNGPFPRILNPDNTEVHPLTPCYCSIQVTVIGRFQAVSEEEARRGRGFGHLGLSPFQLIVESVKDPEAKECPQAGGQH